jgi:hypothetical protein
MDPGLCGHCAHCQLIDGARSRFYLCRLAALDVRFPRYPRLPVVSCAGHLEGMPALDSQPRGPRP